jgi:uncharacterized protein YciI
VPSLPPGGRYAGLRVVRAGGARNVVPMFVLELTYTAPLARIDELLPEHAVWLERGYAAGLFLASGRKEPRDGGVILAAGDDRARIEALAATDPFARAGACTYRITGFVATKTAPELASRREDPPETA